MILRNAGFLTWLRRPSRSPDLNPCSTCKPLDMDTEHTAQPRHSHGNRDGYIFPTATAFEVFYIMSRVETMASSYLFYSSSHNMQEDTISRHAFIIKWTILLYST